MRMRNISSDEESCLIEKLRKIETLFARTTNPGERQAAESLQEVSDAIPSEPYDGFYTDVMYPARFEEERFARSQLRDALTASSVIYEGAPLLVLTGWDDYITVLADGLRLEFAS